jgi:GNAT superfamily N-acetyltransferase
MITPADPTGVDATACLAAYYAELDRRFPGGFAAPDSDPALLLMVPPTGLFLIARDHDTPIGCVTLIPQSPGIAEVKRLWVAAPARGTGLGSRLMAAVTDHARSLGYTRVRLDTSAHLPEAVAMYRRWGWTPIARYNDNPYAAHWFEHPL